MKLATPNLSRPDLAFACVWLVVLAAYLPLETPITPPLDPRTMAMLAFNIATAPLIYFWVNRVVTARHGTAFVGTAIRLAALDVTILARFLQIVVALWLVTYIASAIYSRGLPIFWYLTGDARTYSDFGIPSLGGISNMFRDFAAAMCVLLLVATRRRVYALVWAVLLVSCLAQVARATAFIFLLQSVCVYLLLRTLTMRQFAIAILAAITAVGSFVWLGSIRGIAMQATDLGASTAQSFGGVPLGAYWTWAYLVSPLGNVNYAVSIDVQPLYVPYFTLQTVLPSVLRMSLFRFKEFPVPLLTDSLNATSMYAPLFSDFGLIGATVAISIFQVIASYVYVLARRGMLFHVFLYPALYASIVLSIFYSFALTPGVLITPFVCLWLRRFVERKRATVPAILAAGPTIAR